MSDLGTDIRSYYERVAERIDPTVPPVNAMPRRAYTIRARIGFAVLVGLIVLLAFGLTGLLTPSEPDPASPPTTAPAPTVPSTLVQSAGPLVVVSSNGEEIGSLPEFGISGPAESRDLFGQVHRELTSNDSYWPEGVAPPDLAGLTVSVSIDTAVQEVVESIIGEWRTDPDVVIAVVVVDNDSGRILAAASGRPVCHFQDIHSFRNHSRR